MSHPQLRTKLIYLEGNNFSDNFANGFQVMEISTFTYVKLNMGPSMWSYYLTYSHRECLLESTSFVEMLITSTVISRSSMASVEENSCTVSETRDCIISTIRIPSIINLKPLLTSMVLCRVALDIELDG